jgi:3',5'-cyclic AMP phosphodiesterase CpdA
MEQPINALADNSAGVTLAHFSDVHVTCRPLGWRRADWFNKRMAAWLNLRVLGRAFRFRRADEVLAALADDLRRQRPNHVIFSGDATALGFEAELAHAARLIGLRDGATLPGLAVPGNHDYCTRQAEAGGAFERLFAPWQAGERVDGAVYPFAQRVGPVWLVAVNSSTANRWAWDASGAVDPPQLERLERLLERLGDGPRILVTHYPLCLANGRRERRSHGLRNLNDLIAAAQRGRICLWLHGHRHGPYHHPSTDLAPFPVICAGSATQNGLWSYMTYTIGQGRLAATRRTFDPRQATFREVASFELPLGGTP